MSIIKPPPLQVGDHYYYTLSSYDPVEVEVVVPRVIEEEIDFATDIMVAEYLIKTNSDESCTLDEILENIPEEFTDEWVAEHLKDAGMTTVEELRARVRSEIEHANANSVEEMKGKRCIEELAERLCQEPPEDEIARCRKLAERLLKEKLHEMEVGSKLSVQKALGMTNKQYKNLINEHGMLLAKSHAAFSAFAAKRKLTVSEEEFPALLNMSPKETRDAIAEAKSNNEYDALRQIALNAKVTNVLIAECSCTYRIETEEEARQRISQITED